MPAGAAVAIGGVVAGSMASSATKKAGQQSAQAITDSSEQATQLQRDALAYTSQLSMPQIRMGAEANARRMLMLGYTPDQVKSYLREVQNLRPFGAPATTPAYGGVANTGGGGGGSETPASLRPGIDPRFNTQNLPPGLLELINSGGVFGTPNTNAAAPNPTTPAPTTGAAPAADPLAWIDEFDPQSFLESTPGFQFRMNEGQKAVERSAAARGGLFSGRTGKELTRYGQGVASDYWDDLFNEYGALATGGQTAGRDLNQGVSGYADAASNNLMAAGQARASGYQQAGAADANLWGKTVPGALGFAYGAANGWYS